jgi:hypothetical protein
MAFELFIETDRPLDREIQAVKGAGELTGAIIKDLIPT